MKENNSINDRILKFIEYLGIGLDVFAHLCDIKADYILNGDIKPTDSALQNILSTYPELNPHWIKYGKGNMLGLSFRNLIPQDSILLDFLERHISKEEICDGIEKRYMTYRNFANLPFLTKSSDEFKQLKLDIFRNHKAAIRKICNEHPNLNPQWLEYGDGYMVNDWLEFAKSICYKPKWGFKEALSTSDIRLVESALKSYAFRWAIDCVKRGVGVVGSALRLGEKEIPIFFNPELIRDHWFERWLYIDAVLIPKYLSLYSEDNCGYESIYQTEEINDGDDLESCCKESIDLNTDEDVGCENHNCSDVLSCPVCGGNGFSLKIKAIDILKRICKIYSHHAVLYCTQCGFKYEL